MNCKLKNRKIYPRLNIATTIKHQNTVFVMRIIDDDESDDANLQSQ